MVPTGGSVPVFDEVVISLARMNQIIKLDVEAGEFESIILLGLRLLCRSFGLPAWMHLGGS